MDIFARLSDNLGKKEKCMRKKSVVIADDFPIVGVGLRKILEEAGDFDFKGAARNVYSLRAFLNLQRAPDLVVVDSAMPRCDLSELLESVREWAPSSNVLLFCSADEEFTALLGFKKGVRGVLPKSAEPEEIVRACRTVACGGTYLSGIAAEKITDYVAKKPWEGGKSSARPFLSAREYMVLKNLAAGDKMTKIASESGLSPKTVATYKERLMTKTGARTLAGLIRYALQNDLLSDG
jgi:DNA-binding NarL/FixJ family response regulator